MRLRAPEFDSANLALVVRLALTHKEQIIKVPDPVLIIRVEQHDQLGSCFLCVNIFDPSLIGLAGFPWSGVQALPAFSREHGIHDGLPAIRSHCNTASVFGGPFLCVFAGYVDMSTAIRIGPQSEVTNLSQEAVERFELGFDLSIHHW